MQTSLNILWMLLSAALVFLMQPGFMCPRVRINPFQKQHQRRHKKSCGFLLFRLRLLGNWIRVDVRSLAIRLIRNRPLVSLTGFLFTAGKFFPFSRSCFAVRATTIFSGRSCRKNAFFIVYPYCLSDLNPDLSSLWALGLGRPEYGGNDRAAGPTGICGFRRFQRSAQVSAGGSPWLLCSYSGPRIGRFPDDGPPNEMTASNLPLSVLGCFLLWVGLVRLQWGQQSCHECGSSQNTGKNNSGRRHGRPELSAYRMAYLWCSQGHFPYQWLPGGTGGHYCRLQRCQWPGCGGHRRAGWNCPVYFATGC